MLELFHDLKIDRNLHIKRIAPFNILCAWFTHESVREKPHYGRGNNSRQEEVDKNYVENEVDGLEES